MRPGKSPIALRVVLDDGTGLRPDRGGHPQAVGRVRRPRSGVRAADRLARARTRWTTAFDRAAFGALLAGRRTQIKGLLRDQSVLAGVGNAYSDEVLHAAKLSPYALAGSLSEEQVDDLYEALESILRERGRPARRAGRRPS